MASIGPQQFSSDGFDAVIFDLDGTLVDSMPTHFEAWCEALSHAGANHVFKEDVFHAMGGRPTKDIVADLNNEYGLKLDAVSISLAKRDAFLKMLHRVELIEEVSQFARSLRGKVPIAIATGGSRPVVEKMLKHFDMCDLFEEVVTSSDVKEGKPSPDVYLHTAKLLGVKPERCLVFEDAPAGIIAAEKAGMTVITVPFPSN